MKKRVYASYGSNMSVRRMAERCPAARVLGKGELRGYRLTFRGSGVANVEASVGGAVPIVLWEITPKCEKALDIYEGYPRLYIKRDIEVIVGGAPVQAFVYVMLAKYEAMPALPSRYYFDIIHEGYADNGIDPALLYEALERCENQA